MILFPNAKINIGLRVLRRRSDGYHDIDSIFVPLPWCDILEIVPAKGTTTTLNIVGNDSLKLNNTSDNLVIKALKAIESHIGHQLPPLDIYLSKCIPTGAGLGGGSADASFAIKGVNQLLGLGLTEKEMATIAANVGADCPFFIYNRPMHVEGIGDIMTPVDIPSLDSLHIVAVKIPGTEISTREAYAGVHRGELIPGQSLTDDIIQDADKWQNSCLSNDFEPSVFKTKPLVRQLKELMQQADGAIYCSMSGSGSTIFALFKNGNKAQNAAESFKITFADADIFTAKLSSKPIG